MNRSAIPVLMAVAIGAATVGVPAAVASLDPPALAVTTDDPGDSEIYLIDTIDGTPVNMTMDPATDAKASWAPFGRRLAFVSDRSGEPALFTSRPDGSGGLELAPAESLDWTWAPDGRAIAWVSHQAWKDLWVTDLVTGEAVNLTNGSMEVWSPAWSPDGRRIAFESTVGHGFADVFVIAPESGSPVNLTNDQFGNDHSPAWSPDGTRIAFVSQRDGRDGLYTMASDGSNVRRLHLPSPESCSIRIGSLTWSPDGSALAFGETGGCGGPVAQSIEYKVVPSSGGEVILLAAGGALRSAGSAWSPDGTRLAVVTGGLSRQDVVMVDADGTDAITLTGHFPDGSGTRSPTWSPDGSRLAFVVDPAVGPRADPPPPTTFAVWLVDPDGTNLQVLVAGDQPAWRPRPARPVGLVDPAAGLWHLHGERAFFFGTRGDIPLLGDWDCDGVETAGLYRPVDGYVYLTNANATGIAAARFHLGIAGDLPLAGDFDGDGCDTVSVYRPLEGRVFIADRLGSHQGWLAADYDFYFGIPGDQPFVGDFDGDGVDTVGLHRSSTGFVYLLDRLETATAESEFYYGIPSDRLVAADWTGDGVDTLAIYRPAEARFHIRYSNTAGYADEILPFGNGGWLPIAGGFSADIG